MACKVLHTSTFVDQMLTTAFVVLGNRQRTYPYLGRGPVGLLESIGLSYTPVSSGFDVLDEEGKPVIRVRFSNHPDHITLYVEPAQLVLKTFEHIHLPIQKREVML